MDRLFAALQSGPLPARALTQALGISQPTLSRRIASAGEAVVAFGAARRSSYALRRRVGGHDRFAIHRVRAKGSVEAVGELIPVHPAGYIARIKEEEQYLQSLPWWLQDMRPQGFLGRSFVHAHAAALNLPPQIELWNDDHCLIALAERGEDFIGNLIVGEGSLSRFLAQSNTPSLPASQRAEHYPQFARAALAGEIVGSSAGGEQPKFSTLVQHADGTHAVLVKFNAPGDNEITARWRSLLIAEHLAHESLNAAGIRAAQSELLFVDGQCFLEIRRFDRVGLRGRRGLVSLAALDNAFVGRAAAPWPIVSAALARARHIAPQADAGVQGLHVFGRLIGNSDMHGGNIAFLHDGAMPLSMAPAFDMLPMHWAPRNSGLIPQEAIAPTIDTPPSLEIWREMLPLAARYWKTLREDERLDTAFRRAAAGTAQHIDVLMSRLGAEPATL